MPPAISELPIIVIGAGPTGLAAAAHLLDKGDTPLVLEAGARVGAHVLSWAHVRMFSPWEFNVDRVAARMLEASGWSKPPASEYPTGGELVRNYLEPLAALPELRPHVRPGARVTGLSPRSGPPVDGGPREHSLCAARVNVGRRRAAARACGDRRLGDAALGRPAGRRRPPGDGRARAGGPRVLRHPRCTRRTARPLRGSAHAGPGQRTSAFTVSWTWSLSPTRRRAQRVWVICRRSLGSLLGGGTRRAARTRTARRAPPCRRERAVCPLPEPPHSSDSRSRSKGLLPPAATGWSRPWTRSWWSVPGSVRISACCASYALPSIRSLSVQLLLFPSSTLRSIRGTVLSHGEGTYSANSQNQASTWGA